MKDGAEKDVFKARAMCGAGVGVGRGGRRGWMKKTDRKCSCRKWLRRRRKWKGK